MFETLFQRLAQRAAMTPDAVAVEATGYQPLSYRNLHNHLQSVVDTLNGIGIGRGDRVAIVLPAGPEMATACLGILAGATAAPLNPEYRAAEFEYRLSSLGAKLLIVRAGLESHAKSAARALGIPIVELSPAPNRVAGLFRLSCDIVPSGRVLGGIAQADDAALVLQTSGTTSRPKTVPLTQHNLLTSVENLAQSLQLSASDRCLHFLPYFHIGGLVDLLAAPLAVGSTVICTPGFSVPEFYNCLASFQPSWAQAVPTMLQEILSYAADHRDVIERHSLRLMRSVSAALPAPVMKDFERIFKIPVIEIFGMTEAAGVITSNPLPPAERKIGSVGRAAGTELGIMNETGTLAGIEQTGEVVIRGENVMRGYENAPEENRKAFSGPWFRTGDLGYLDEDGYLFLTGRIKEIINRGGEKISPHEVDEVLLTHSCVAEAATFAIPHVTLGEDVSAAVVLKAGATLGKPELIDFVAARLAYFKVPRTVYFLDTLPKGPGGKLKRNELAELFALRPSDSVTPSVSVAPAKTPIAKMLVEMWSKVLGVEQIGVDDDFFDNGGDSMKAASFINELQKRWRDTVYVSAIFDAPSVAKFENYLQKNYPQLIARMLGQYLSPKEPVVASKFDASKLAQLRQSLARPPRILTPSKTKNQPAIFILSPPRSGSTLLRVMLGGHSQLFAPPELYLLPFDHLADRKAFLSGSQRFQLEGNVRAVMQLKNSNAQEAQELVQKLEERQTSTQDYYRMMQDWLGDRILLDKTPSYAVHLETLQRAEETFENPIYIYLLRHPYGMIRSFEEAKLEQLWYPRMVGTEAAYRTPCPYPRREFAELIWLILDQNIVEFLADIPRQRQIRVKFENLVSDPKGTMETLCEFLKLNFEPAMLQPQSNKQERMTDGLHPQSRMIGDMKFHQHEGIVSQVAERWKQEYETDFLADETLKLALALGYNETLAKVKNRKEFEL